MKTTKKKHIVIIGGGFGGLRAALALRNTSVRVTLIDKRNFHLFQPLLYQVATGGLSPADIAFPLRAVLKKQKNIQVVLGTVNDIDFNKRQVQVDNRALAYDELIIASGSSTYYFGQDKWAESASGLKTVEDATSIRSKILSAFEKAELENDPEKKAALLTFAIIGGGPAGVEMAGAIAEISRHTLQGDFHNINPSQARIILIEGNERILSMYPPELSEKAEKTLQKLDVKVWTKHFVNNIHNNRISLKTTNGELEVEAETMIWAAGVKAASLGNVLKQKYDLAIDKSGRIIVKNDCTIPDYPNVFVIGDMAHFQTENGDILPGVAAVATQQGRYVAKLILNQEANKDRQPFHYLDKGNLAVIGRKSAVAFRGKVKLSGPLAWLLWIFIHLLYLVGAENRILVAIQWGFNYFTFGRSARLIVNNSNVC